MPVVSRRHHVGQTPRQQLVYALIYIGRFSVYKAGMYTTCHQLDLYRDLDSCSGQDHRRSDVRVSLQDPSLTRRLTIHSSLASNKIFVRFCGRLERSRACLHLPTDPRQRSCRGFLSRPRAGSGRCNAHLSVSVLYPDIQSISLDLFPAWLSHDLDRTLTYPEGSRSMPIDVKVDVRSPQDLEMLKYLTPNIARTRPCIIESAHANVDPISPSSITPPHPCNAEESIVVEVPYILMTFSVSKCRFSVPSASTQHSDPLSHSPT